MSKKAHKSKHQPVEYDEIYCNKIVAFFNVPFSFVKKIKYFNKHGKENYLEKTVPNPNPPTMPGFLASIEATEEDLAAWRVKDPIFDYAYKLAYLLYEDYIIKSGMLGLMPSSVFKHLTKNQLGWADKIDLEITGDITVDKGYRQPIENRISSIRN